MNGWTIKTGLITQAELRWVDSFEDQVSDGNGQHFGRGEWSLLLDTAKHIALMQVEVMYRNDKRGGYDASAERHASRLKEMRGEGNYQITMKKDSR